MKRLTRRLTLALVTALPFLPATASAQDDDAGRLGLRFQNIVSGKELPAILLKPADTVSKLVIELKSSDGKTSKLSSGRIGAGADKRLEVRQPPGTKLDYEAKFDVTWGDGATSSFQMRFTLARVEELGLKFDKSDVDLDKRTMTFTITGSAVKVELTIVGENKQVLKTVTKDVAGHKPNEKVTISYPDPGATILFMDLKVFDVTGGFKGVHLTPVSTSIPHDDVEFDSGKWDIRPGEEHKLEATKKNIDEAVEKFKKAGVELELKLYVAGYTDTVGSHEANRTLSNNRARAIAQWFVKHGIKLDVFYQGFGEEVLAKRTPDETDEPRNRRAVYVLATQTPGKSGLFPRTNWAPAK
ncbi:MAG: OmpA family protein [Myxococcales bacterium]|nr:OmpA family protein [Myxococcales bacterium]